ncbi:MAG: glycosyltransferase family 4 protein [Thermoguttaceae bacterium]|jgi:glycosyltransferase involved in cell wall biosynthesis|nr:glycosyltransferase family 4 protein [Thermoguttaceae bacterium]
MATICLLCEYPTLCGGERSMLSTLDAVRAAGFRMMAAAPPAGSLADALAENGIEQIPFSVFEPGGERRTQAAIRGDLDHLLRRCRPDVLHANSLAMGRLSGPVAAEAGVPSIAHLRDIVRLSRQAIEDLNRHHRLLAVSHAVRRYYLAAGLEDGKTRVIYNGVDLARFQPRPPTGYLHRELGLPPDARLVGTIGQICLRKGQDVLIQAATALADRVPDAHYLIVGQRNSQKQESVDFEARLHCAARQGPLAGRLHLVGERDDIHGLLNELVLLVHPARQEPLGRVLLEAAASGVAVVATAVGGTDEIFPPHSHSARLVAHDSASALAEAMAGLLDDDHARLTLGQAARARAESAFGLDPAGTALAAEYAAVAGIRRHG